MCFRLTAAFHLQANAHDATVTKTVPSPRPLPVLRFPKWMPSTGGGTTGVEARKKKARAVSLGLFGLTGVTLGGHSWLRRCRR